MMLPHPTPTLFPYTTLFRSAPPSELESRFFQNDIQETRHEESVLVQACFVRRAGRRGRAARLGRRRNAAGARPEAARGRDRKSTRLNSSHVAISYAVFCLKK